MRSAVIIYNPHAGRGKAPHLAAAANRRLSDAGFSDIRTVATEYPLHATQLAATVTAPVERIVVIGGDGSVREAAQGLVGRNSDVSLGILPLGNANVLARELGIPLDPTAALNEIAGDHTTRIHCGRANGTVFLCMLGVGFDAGMLVGMRSTRQSAIGRWLYRLNADAVYGLVAIRRLIASRPERLAVTIDSDTSPRDVHSVIVANTATYAKGWTMVPDADPRAGGLHVQLRESGSMFNVAASYLAAARRRQAGPRVATYLRGEDIRIRNTSPFAYQIDGDAFSETDDLKISVSADTLKIVTPLSGFDAK